MITDKTVKILLLLVLAATITNNTIPAFAAKSSKSNSNVDKFSISSSNGNNIWKSHNENNNTHRYFTNILDKSIVDSVNTSDDGLFDTKHNEGKKIPEAPPILRRGKRYLDFVKGTRVSWRTTVKNNILKVNTLWGYGFGFRSNFPFADKADRLRPFFKRDLLHATVDMLDGHGLDGRACLLKSYCTAKLDGDSPIGGGMIFKLLKMLLRLDHEDKRHFPFLNLDNCQQILHSHCPLSFNSISPYTDDV